MPQKAKTKIYNIGNIAVVDDTPTYWLQGTKPVSNTNKWKKEVTEYRRTGNFIT